MTDRAAKTQSGWYGFLKWILNNGPASVTVLGSVALAVTASFVDIAQPRILQAILALLALIGGSLLTERLIEGRSLRDRLGAVDERLDEVLTYARDIETAGLDSLVIRRRELSSLEERLQGAKKVAISGGSLFRLANEYQSLFEHLAEDGCHLRFIMVDPKTAAAEALSSAVVYESRNVEAYRTQMQASLTTLTSLAARYPSTCEVKLSSIAPSFSLMVIEKGWDSSTVQVELYPFRLPARDRPTLLLEKGRDPKLHELFSSQFDGLWNSELCRGPGISSP